MATVYGIENTQPFYPGLDGFPLQNGKMWFGASGQNPVTSPVSVYLDSAGTQPVAQPVSVSNGRTVDTYGNAISLYVPGDFSRLVVDSQGRTVLFQSSQPQTQSAASAAASAALALSGAGFVNVLGYLSDVQKADVFAGTYAQDLTTALTNAVNAAAGKTLYFPEYGAGGYLTGRLIIQSNTTLWFDPGVTLKKKASGLNLLNFTNVSNCIVYANGANFLGDDLTGSTTYSHTIIFQGAKKCVIHDANINGASGGGAGKDCIYIGAGATPSEDIWIVGGKCLNSKRNGISVAAARRTIIDGVEISGAVGAPGAGIDIEANFYGDVYDTLVQNCHIHDNQNGGIFSIFGERSIIRNNEIHNNGSYGIGVSAGGVEFNAGVYRSNVDVRGVSAFDMATGAITVGGDLALLPVGTIVNFWTVNTGSVPAEIAGGSYYVVSRHVGTNQVILGASVDQGEVTTFATAGTGTLSTDPAVSDVRMRCIVRGQSNDYTVADNRIYSNGAQGIFFSTSLGHKVHRNKIWDNALSQIQLSYCSECEITENTIYQTSTAVANVNGITSATGGGRYVIADNIIQNCRTAGISLTSWTGCKIERNEVWNCGAFGAGATLAGISLTSIVRPIVRNNNVRQSSTNATTLYGIYTDGTVTKATIEGNDCTSAGSSNTNSIVTPSTATLVQNNTLKDGSRQFEGSTTTDVASIAAGAQAQVAVTVAGVALSDMVAGWSPSVSIGAVMGRAAVTAANTVTIYLDNNTSGAIDPPNATYRVKCIRANA